MTLGKRKLFLAYASSQAALARRYEDVLSEKFEVVTWEAAQKTGASILNSTMTMIGECSFGVALLSCDDAVQHAAGSVMQPRDNVVFEAGLMLGLYGRSRTAIVTVKARDGTLPKLPTDFSGILHETEPYSADGGLAVQAHRVADMLLGRNPDYLPTCSGAYGDSRGFNVVPLAELTNFWHEFHGKFFCVNPSWQLELSEEKWLESHYRRYMDPDFTTASYVIDVDRGRNSDDDDMRHSDSRRRIVNSHRDLAGIARFVRKLVKQHPDVERNLTDKLTVYVRPGIRTEITTFVGTIAGLARAFLFVRRIGEDVVLEARSARVVDIQRARIATLIGEGPGYRFDKLDELERCLLGSDRP